MAKKNSDEQKYNQLLKENKELKRQIYEMKSDQYIKSTQTWIYSFSEDEIFEIIAEKIANEMYQLTEDNDYTPVFLIHTVLDYVSFFETVVMEKIGEEALDDDSEKLSDEEIQELNTSMNFDILPVSLKNLLELGIKTKTILPTAMYAYLHALHVEDDGVS